MSTSSRIPGEVRDPAGRPRRRTFTAEYKARIVAEYDATPDGGKAAILRREGLYSSHLIEWRRALSSGTLASAASKKAERARVDAAELARLRKANARLEKELVKTREALVIMGKAHALLDAAAGSAD